jgi:hypothetical protein
MADKYRKKYSASLPIKEIQVKMILRFNLRSVRMGILNKTKNKKCWQGCRVKETLKHCKWECKLVWLLWKSVCISFKKLKGELPLVWSAIAILAICVKECTPAYYRVTCTPLLIVAPSTSSQAMGLA